MKDLVKKLVEAWGPSGFEHHVRALIEEEVADLCDEMHVDSMGSLHCRVGTKTDDNLRIMIAAHMDEIGVMVSHIDREGYLRFANIGGVFPLTLNGNRVRFENGVIGTVGSELGWRSTETPKLDNFYIDVSASTEDGKNKNADIKVGDPAGFWRTMEERGDRLIAKSMDDRIGCVVAILAMRELKKVGCAHEVIFVFTVQEEVGVRGAKAAAYGVDPDLGIALDICPTGDQPKTSPGMDVKLGTGAAIKVRDNGLIVPPAVKNLMIDTAEKYDIPYQLEILQLGSTDASAIQLARAGVPSGCISIPTRYAHTVSETVDVNDVQACTDLLVKILSNPIENIKPS